MATKKSKLFGRLANSVKSAQSAAKQLKNVVPVNLPGSIKSKTPAPVAPGKKHKIHPYT